MGTSDGAAVARPATGRSRTGNLGFAGRQHVCESHRRPIVTWEHGVHRPPNVRGGSTMSYVGDFPDKAEALVASISVFAGWASDADL